MPCSSGNSPTISVTRSALARRAAVWTCCATHPANRTSRISPLSPESPFAGMTVGLTSRSSTSQRASLATRSTLSATVPSFSWKTIWSSFFACSSSGILRSCSQKNWRRRGGRRGPSRCPATIAAPPSTASILAVQTKFGRQPALAVRAGEIFLVGAHGELDHLARDLEERGVEAAEQRHRPFGQAGILGDQALVLDQRQAGGGRGGARRLRAMMRGALGGVDDDVAGAQLLDIIVGAADGDRRRDGGSGGRASRRRSGRRRSRSRRSPRRAGRRCPAAGGPSAGFRSRRGRAPAHRLGPGEGADDRGDRLGEHVGGGAAGLLDRRRTDAVALARAGPG